MRGIIATGFVWNRGDDTTGIKKRHIIVLNCSVFQVNKAWSSILVMKNMLGSHVGGRGWGGPEIWLTDRQMFALRGDSMSLGMGGGYGALLEQICQKSKK